METKYEIRESEPHQAAIVVVKDAEGKVLLLRRTAQDRSFVGWCFPGGKKEKYHMNLQETALDELAQETGLSFSNAREVSHKQTEDKRGRKYDVAVFEVQLPIGTEISPIRISEEHEGYAWISPGDVLASPDQYPLAGEMTKNILTELSLKENKAESEKELCWPLPGVIVEVPQGADHPGSFGARRKFDMHTGVDIYAEVGQQVCAVESGRVVAIDPLFTGGPDTPLDKEGNCIWLKTAAVFVEGASGVLVYGEIEVDEGIKVRMEVKAGQAIGKVLSVLRPKPGGRQYKNPANSPSMLHFEMYTPGTTQAVFWKLNEPKPDYLLDPTELLLKAKNGNKVD